MVEPFSVQPSDTGDTGIFTPSIFPLRIKHHLHFIGTISCNPIRRFRFKHSAKPMIAQLTRFRLVWCALGKGAGGGDPYGERGVLKRQTPLWLRLPEFRRHIVGFEAAGIGHGGEGALYVTLRRTREP